MSDRLVFQYSFPFIVIRVYFRLILRALRLRLFNDRRCNGHCLIDERCFFLFRLADG